MSEETTKSQTAEEIAAAQDAAEAKAAADAAAAEAKKGRPTKARLLQDCEHGKANDLVTLPEGEAKALQAAGVLDTHKTAVAYAESLEQNQK